MTDRELLEAAAKAAGIEGEYFEGPTPGHHVGIHQGYGHYWNPLTDDGDVFRLAVKLGLEVSCDGHDKVLVGWPDPHHPGSSAEDDCMFYSNVSEPKGDDPYAATRLAIVRAAAEIGRAALGETKREG